MQQNTTCDRPRNQDTLNDGPFSSQGPKKTDDHSSQGTICPLCNELLSSRRSSIRHIQRKLPGRDIPILTGSHHCTLCETFFGVTLHDLALHYHSVHGKDVYIQTSHFPDMDQFENWRERERERERAVSYTHLTLPTKLSV